MTLPLELTTAIEDARRHAEEARKGRPFDPVYVHTLEQLAIIDRHILAGDFPVLRPAKLMSGGWPSRNWAMTSRISLTPCMSSNGMSTPLPETMPKIDDRRKAGP